MGAVEDLFEFKISVGAQALATAIIASPEIPNERQKQMLRLIENTFDDVHFLTGQPQTLAEEFYLRRVLFRREPKVNLIHLWKSEAEFQLDAARREIPPAELSSLVDKSRIPIGHNAGQAEERLYDVLTRSGRPVVPNPKIETIKPFVGKLKFPYRLNFDFMVNAQRPVLVELIRIARSNITERLRYISLKARLTRYAVAEDGLIAHKPGYRALLVVDGNVAGPDHDPARYLRAIMRAGWNVVSQDRPQEILEIIADEKHLSES